MGCGGDQQGERPLSPAVADDGLDDGEDDDERGSGEGGVGHGHGSVGTRVGGLRAAPGQQACSRASTMRQKPESPPTPTSTQRKITTNPDFVT